MDSIKVKLWSRTNLTACHTSPALLTDAQVRGRKSRRFCRNGTQSQKGRGGSGRKEQVEIQDRETHREQSWEKRIGVTEKWEFGSKNDESWTDNPKCISS